MKSRTFTKEQAPDAPMEIKKKKDKENSVTYMLHFKHDDIKKPTHRQQIIQPKETIF